MDCLKAKALEHYKKNATTIKNHYRKYNRKLREAALAAYGNKCACCGEDTYEFLAIDHINGGGRWHHRQVRGRSHSMTGWLKKNGYPSGFRLLCHNCNHSRGYYGYCPHEKKEEPIR